MNVVYLKFLWKQLVFLAHPGFRQRLASASHNEQVIRVWEVASAGSLSLAMAQQDKMFSRFMRGPTMQVSASWCCGFND